MLWFQRHVLRRRTSAAGGSERGATAVEYGVILTLFVVGMFGAITLLRTSLNNSYAASEVKVGSPQSAMTAPSIVIDYAMVGACAAQGKFYDALGGECEAAPSCDPVTQWPNWQTHTCDASLKTSTCKPASQGYDITTNTCTACTGGTPFYQDGTVSCVPQTDCTASNQIPSTSTNACVTPAGPGAKVNNQKVNVAGTTNVLSGWSYASTPYTAAITVNSTTKSWTGNPTPSAATASGGSITLPAINRSSGTVTITYTITITYPWNGTTKTATVTGNTLAVTLTT